QAVREIIMHLRDFAPRIFDDHQNGLKPRRFFGGQVSGRGSCVARSYNQGPVHDFEGLIEPADCGGRILLLGHATSRGRAVAVTGWPWSCSATDRSASMLVAAMTLICCRPLAV